MIDPKDYARVGEYLNGPLKQIKTIESTESHTTIVYWIPPTSTNRKRICDDCQDKATFLCYDRDHNGRTAINLSCNTHANQSYSEWLNESDSAVLG